MIEGKLMNRLERGSESYGTLRALEWLIENSDLGKQGMDLSTIAEEWGWNESAVISLLDALKNKGTISWSTDDSGNVVTFSKCGNIVLQAYGNRRGRR